MYRKEIISRIGAVKNQHDAAALAVDDLLRRAASDPTLLLAGKVTMAELRGCLNFLGPTYLVRMYAVFEEALREVRGVVYGKSGPIRAYDLLQQCAARQSIPHSHLANAHQVREYRNTVVHGGTAAFVTISQARTWLCEYFSYMPPKW